MLVIPDIVRIARKRPAIAALPTALTLVAATYESTTSVTLTFDRAIDVSAIDVEAVVVDDGEEQSRLRGTAGVVALSPTSVRVLLVADDTNDTPGVHLSVAPNNGIVALDGAAWAGCNDLTLPFG